MKRSDTLLSASSNLQAEVGVMEFTAVPTDNSFMESCRVASTADGTLSRATSTNPMREKNAVAVVVAR